MSKHNFTIDEIRSKYTQEKQSLHRENLWGYFVLLKASYYPTWLFLKLDISANRVTISAIVIGCIGCLLLAFGWYWSVVVGALLINTAALFDYIDGNIARFTNSCSKLGGYLDTLQGYIITALLPLGIGIGLFYHPDSTLKSLANFVAGVHISRDVFPLLGASASFFSLFTFLVSNRFALAFSMKPRDFFRPVDSPSAGSWWKAIYRVGLNLYNVDGILMPIMFVSAILRSLSIFIVFWLLITASGFVAILIQTMIKSKSIELRDTSGELS